MPLRPASVQPPCIVVVIDTWSTFVAIATLLALPVLAAWLIIRTVRRNPSVEYLAAGRRRSGVLVGRLATGATAIGLLAVIAASVLQEPSVECTDEPLTAWDRVAVAGVLLMLLGVVVVGIGWGHALRAEWIPIAVVLATDVVIFYGVVLEEFAEPGISNGLLLLGLAVHGGSTTLALRWQFRVRDRNRLRRAQAGEAGRTLAAVWVFLAAYTVLGIVGGLGEAFDPTVEAAVIGALTLGALAATMGSGVTKYVEASYLDAQSAAADVVAEATRRPPSPPRGLRSARTPKPPRRSGASRVTTSRITPSSATRSGR